MTTPLYTIIRFTLVNRARTASEPCWLATVSYADGPGYKVKKMTTTRDRSKAARFSLATAYTVAVQFSKYPAALERPDGTPLPEDTARLQTEQVTRYTELRQLKAELQRQFNEAMRPVAEALVATGWGGPDAGSGDREEAMTNITRMSRAARDPELDRTVTQLRAQDEARLRAQLDAPLGACVYCGADYFTVGEKLTHDEADCIGGTERFR